jgi:sugar lactone lactonase YvrE
LQHSIFVYSPEGELLDALLCPDLSLSEYVSEQVGGIEAGTALAYNTFEAAVYYRPPGGDEQALPLPGSDSWAPLGIRLDREGNLLLTDVLAGRHAVRQFPGKVMSAASWQEFEPAEMVFGRFGQDAAELAYPNVAVADSSGRIYVTDGNNGRISVWDRGGQFLFNFGRGVGEGALGLPRGAAMDGRDRLHVVDTVEQKVKVYDVAGSEPEFLFAFGDWGNGDGQFNFPNDISLDRSGRLYIADRENDRIQVWSY